MFESEYGESSSIWRKVIGVVIVAALIGGGYFLFTSMSGGSNKPRVASLPPFDTTTEATDATVSVPAGATTTTVASSTDDTVVIGSTPVAPPPSDPAGSSTTTTVVVASDAPPPSTLPDGSYAPIVAIFDTGTISLQGAVPSQAASDLLESLAAANSKTPGVAVLNLTTIDPRVPAGIGIRVIELTASRFPEGKDVVVPEHALELDRVVNIMNAFPNVTVLVIGHADQNGTVEHNQELSERRAVAVVNYMESHGISADRLSSRAVGENDLLSLNSDAASLAMNRRTEFVFYGLLIGA